MKYISCPYCYNEFAIHVESGVVECDHCGKVVSFSGGEVVSPDGEE